MAERQITVGRELGEIRIPHSPRTVVNYIYNATNNEWSTPFLGHLIKEGDLWSTRISGRCAFITRCMASLNMAIDNQLNYESGSAYDTYYITANESILSGEWGDNNYAFGSGWGNSAFDIMSDPRYLIDRYYSLELVTTLISNIRYAGGSTKTYFIEMGSDLLVQILLQNNYFLDALDSAVEEQGQTCTFIFLTDALVTVPASDPSNEYTTPQGHHPIYFWPKVNLETCFKAGYCMGAIAFNNNLINPGIITDRLNIVVPPQYFTSWGFVGEYDYYRDPIYLYQVSRSLGDYVNNITPNPDNLVVDPALMGMLNAISCGANAAYLDLGGRSTDKQLTIQLIAREVKGDTPDLFIMDNCCQLPTIFLPEMGRSSSMLFNYQDIDSGGAWWWFMTHSFNDVTYETPYGCIELLDSIGLPHTWSGTTHSKLRDFFTGVISAHELGDFGADIYSNLDLIDDDEIVIGPSNPRIATAYQKWLTALKKMDVSFIEGSPYVFNRPLPREGIRTNDFYDEVAGAVNNLNNNIYWTSYSEDGGWYLESLAVRMNQ